MGDGFDFTDIQRQVENLYQMADKCINKARATGRVDEKLLAEGSKYLQQAQEIVEQNLQPILASVNPSDVAAALTAAAGAGAISSQFANQAINCITQAAKQVTTEVVKQGGKYAAGELLGEIASGLGISIGILAGCVAAYLLFKGICNWLDRVNADKLARKAIAAKQFDPQGRPYKYVPFGTPMRPGVAR